MEFIISNEKGEEVALLTDKQYIDIEIGEGSNTFSIRIDKDYQRKWGINAGWRIACQGTEYGGIIDKVKSNTSSSNVTLSGSTWRGILNKKIIEPQSGQDYRIVSGDANEIIRSVVCSEFDGLFSCEENSGVNISNYHFDRYTTHLSGISKMLFAKNARLEIKYDSGKENAPSFVSLQAVPIVDYSDMIEYSADGTLSFLSFIFEEFTGGINHLICLGKGELKDRLVIHLYEQEDGSIGESRFYTGKDERTAVYDYSNAVDAEELREKGVERFRELMSYKKMDMDLYNDSLAELRGFSGDISIGDIVGGRDFDTGIYLSKQITKKIIQIKNGRESIEYSVGESMSRNSTSAPEEHEDAYQKQIDALNEKISGDYIVAQGKSGNWVYKKWNSGFAEMWYDGNIKALNVSNAQGNLYFSDATYLYLPFTLVGYARGYAEVIDPWTMCMVNGGGPNDITVKLYRGSAYTSEISCTVCVYVYGYWK